ncbi:hypothetical protein [Paenibacillus tarimensis]|uniref:hypothetical protein n=1 Tax=Paenibacillus tarimensis TaxID=416012 RepID=UPI0039F10433
MRIWRLDSHEKSRMLTFSDSIPDEHLIYGNFEGVSIKNSWSLVELVTYRKGKYLDFPYFGSGMPVFTPKSYEILAKFVEHEVEFLPFKYEEQVYYLVNVLNVIDCKDKTQSDSKGAVFKGDLLPQDTHIFKTPIDMNSKVYATDHFVEIVRKNKLKGFDFIEVWDSEDNENMESERKRRYEEALNAINSMPGERFSYEEARDRVEQGKAVASDKWKMQLDKDGTLLLGQLKEDDGEYLWMVPHFIPPILLGNQWHEVDKRK